MRRISVVLVLVLAAAVWPATSGLAHSSAVMHAAAARSLEADFNNDGFADLAVGAPFEGVAGIVAGGAVSVLYGTPTGLAGGGSQLFTQDSAGVGDAAEEADAFGFALTAADFDNDAFADLAVGAPFEDVASVVDAGAVNVLYGSAGLLTGAGSQLFAQGAGIGGTPRAATRSVGRLPAPARKAPPHRRHPVPETSARHHVANSLGSGPPKDRAGLEG